MHHFGVVEISSRQFPEESVAVFAESFFIELDFPVPERGDYSRQVRDIIPLRVFHIIEILLFPCLRQEIFRTFQRFIAELQNHSVKRCQSENTVSATGIRIGFRVIQINSALRRSFQIEPESSMLILIVEDVKEPSVFIPAVLRHKPCRIRFSVYAFQRVSVTFFQ